MENEDLTYLERLCEKKGSVIKEECDDDTAYQPTNGHIGPF